jgi:acetyl-CoA C-acetyltransferase
VAIKEALTRAGLGADDVCEVIMGQVLQAGTGGNPARQATLKAGLPITTPAYTVNKVCASGMKAVALGALAVASGEHDIIVAGGMENMSAAPFLLTKERWGQRLGDGKVLDVILRDALTDPGSQCHMGITAENLASEFKISRREQDEFAAESQRRACAAIAAGKFNREIVPVPVPQRKGPSVKFAVDEYPRPDTTATVLATLKPAFKDDGTVTAGNASGINDGAAAMVLLSHDEAKSRGIRPMARIVSYASAALDPMRMGLSPVDATNEALKKAKMSIKNIDAIELNEAFAAQSLAVIGELKLDTSRVNLNGGAIALGHPVGASGARIIVTLLHLMADRNLRLGLATLCVGGGQGMAVVLERI